MLSGDWRENNLGKASVDDVETGIRKAGMDMLRILDSNMSSLGGILRAMYVRIVLEWDLLAAWRKYWT